MSRGSRELLSLIAFAVLVLATALVCDRSQAAETARFPSSVERGTYPYSEYRPLPEATVAQMSERLRQRLGHRFSDVILDKYGLVSHVTTSDPALVPQSRQGRDGFTEEERRRWTKFVAENADVFGMDDSSNFTLKCEWPNNSPPSHACDTLTAGQLVDGRLLDRMLDGVQFDRPLGISVLKSGRDLPTAQNSVMVEGHFFPGARLPGSPRFSQQAVIASVAEKRIMSPWIIGGFACDPPPGGPPCGQGPRFGWTPGTIHADNLELETKPWLFKDPISGNLRLRLANVVRVKHGLSAGAYEIIDAMTGEDLCPDCPLAVSLRRGASDSR